MSAQDSFESDNERWLESLPKKTYSVGLHITGAIQGEPSSLIDSDNEYIDEPIPDKSVIATHHYVAHPKDAPLYVSAIFANGWLIDSHSYDLEQLKAHYNAASWAEHRDEITSNAEWFGKTKHELVFVMITATKPLPIEL